MEGKLPEVRLATTPLKVVSPYEPSGDQPQAIEKLARGVEEGLRYQTLLGVTGSGKTFTMAKTIEAVQKPTLVMAPNKTLAAQLASELKEFFPNNSVVYFVSLLRLLPARGLRALVRHVHREGRLHQRGGGEAAPRGHVGLALAARLHRGGLGVVHLRHRHARWTTPAWRVFVDKQKEMDRDDVIHELIDIQYDRNDYELQARHVPRARRQRSTCSRPMRTTRCASSSGATR